MDTQIQIQGSLLIITGSLDLYAAEALRDGLLQILESGSSPSVNLAGMESCDVACLQLLRCAVQTSAAQGTPLILVDGGTAFPAICLQLGTSIDELFEGGC